MIAYNGQIKRIKKMIKSRNNEIKSRYYGGYHDFREIV